MTGTYSCVATQHMIRILNIWLAIARCIDSVLIIDAEPRTYKCYWWHSAGYMASIPHL